MVVERSEAELVGLVHGLRSLPNETEWVEFKVNNANTEEIGQYISALSNSAALSGRPLAYVVWGIDDTTHEVKGTSFSPRTTKVGNEELENWLLRLLTPQPHFRFFSIEVESLPVVLLEIERATHRPVQFKGREFIRIGSYKQPLRNFPEKERALWRVFDQTPFERGIAAEPLTTGDVLKLLDYPSYFKLTNAPVPENPQAIVNALENDGLVRFENTGTWAITNLGAILFADNLSDFPSLRRKALRVIVYRDNSRVETIKERQGRKGYASEFEDLIAHINGLLPSNEVIEQALRRTVPMYPELAVRELVANALIHQDFGATGTSPMVEIFADRMEITNPGEPIVNPQRFLDSPPRSRNEDLASLMRRMGICEERGSGIDKIVFQTELYQLPAPLFEVMGQATRAVLFAHRPLNRMEKQDRVRACYLHACLRYVSHDYMTNTTLRARFGIEARNSATASRLIKEAIEAGMIKAYDESAARKLMKYVPFWA